MTHSRYIQANDGTELYVKDWGSGRPVVFSHGWPFNADMWDDLANELAERGFRVVSYDRRGFGRSAQPWNGYDFDMLADDLSAILNKRDLTSVTLVGYSMGGGDIVRYLSRHGSKRIAQLALIGTIVAGLPKSPANPQGLDGSMFDEIKQAIRSDRARFMASVVKDVIYDPELTSSHPVTQEVLEWSNVMAMQVCQRALLACVDTFGRTDFRNELPGINVPTLLLHGTADKPVPIDASARPAAKLLPNAKLIEYEGTSHGLIVTERDRVLADLLQFLKT